MRAVVVYESMFGNTREVAKAIGDGLSGQAEVAVVPVVELNPGLVAEADLLVVGGPTHMHGLSRPQSRKMAASLAAKPDKHVSLEPGATGPGLREWLAGASGLATQAAAFDTRGAGSAFMTGRASKQIRRRLRHRGAQMIAPSRSFVVGADNELRPSELDRAREWGRQLARAAAR